MFGKSSFGTLLTIGLELGVSKCRGKTPLSGATFFALSSYLLLLLRYNYGQWEQRGNNVFTVKADHVKGRRKDFL